MNSVLLTRSGEPALSYLGEKKARRLATRYYGLVVVCGAATHIPNGDDPLRSAWDAGKVGNADYVGMQFVDQNGYFQFYFDAQYPPGGIEAAIVNLPDGYDRSAEHVSRFEIEYTGICELCRNDPGSFLDPNVIYNGTMFGLSPDSSAPDNGAWLDLGEPETHGLLNVASDPSQESGVWMIRRLLRLSIRWGPGYEMRQAIFPHYWNSYLCTARTHYGSALPFAGQDLEYVMHIFGPFYLHLDRGNLQIIMFHNLRWIRDEDSHSPTQWEDLSAPVLAQA
jgi:hypothetical protein